MYKYFNMKLESLADLKKEYRELALKHHPDKGGSVETMAEINNEYEKLFKILKQGKKVHVGNDEYADSSELAEDFIYIINAIINLEGVVIKLVGEWLWVTGDTAKYKTVFKANRFRWSVNKKAWYYNPDPEWRKKSRKKLSLGEIERFYGSKRIDKSSYKSNTKQTAKQIRESQAFQSDAGQLSLF